MTIYIGTPLQQQMKKEDKKDFANFLKQYVPQKVVVPENKNERRTWKQQHMVCAISGEITDGIRSNENMVNRDVLALDLDDVAVDSRKELIHRLSSAFDYYSLLYPSVSCSSDNLRYRLIIPLAKEESILDETIYRNTVDFLLQKLINIGILKAIDKSNLTWSQVFGLPIITQMTPQEDKAKLLYEFKDKPKLTFRDCISISEKNQRLNTKPKKQATTDLARKYLENNNDLDSVMQSFAIRNRDWLQNYNNYLACQFEIRYAEVKGEITHEQALNFVSVLAFDEEMAELNRQKYEKDKTIKKTGVGMAYFVSKEQAKPMVDWVKYDAQNKKYSVDNPLLLKAVKEKIHYMRGNFFEGSSVVYYKGEWEFQGAEPILEKTVSQMLSKVGMWSSRELHDTLTFIRTNSYLKFKTSPFDESNPYLVSFKNCLLNVKTLESQEKSIDKLIPISHDVNFHSEWFENGQLKKEFLPKKTLSWLKTLINDDEAVEYLLTLIGYCFVRTYSDSAVVTVIYGTGNNGKSTLLRYISNLIGYQNLSSATLQQLGDNNLRFVSAKLYHKEANIFADTGDSAIKNFDKIKSLSGGDSILAEYKGQDMFEFTNYAKLIFSTNSLPKLKDFSPAIRRRLKVIKIETSFNKEVRNRFEKEFPLEEIYAENEKMIALCIQYIHDFLNGNKKLLEGSQNMKQHLIDWIDKNDTVGAFTHKFIQKIEKPNKKHVGESVKNIYRGYLTLASYYDFDVAKRKDFMKSFDKVNKFKGVSGTNKNTMRFENLVFTKKFFEEIKVALEEIGNPFEFDLENCVRGVEFNNEKKEDDEEIEQI